MARNTLISLSQVRAGLRLFEEHENTVKALQDALIAGEESGHSQPFDGNVF
jgi:antitoxin ParD1/3/4